MVPQYKHINFQLQRLPCILTMIPGNLCSHHGTASGGVRLPDSIRESHMTPATAKIRNTEPGELASQDVVLRVDQQFPECLFPVGISV